MKKLNVLTRMLLLVALLVGSVGNAWGADVTYKLTITASDFNTTSYAANNNEKTSYAVCTTDDKKTYEVKWTSNQVMKQSSAMQWQSGKGYIYNSTDLGTITSVSVTKTAGAFTTYYGTSAQPSSGTAGSGKGYFKTKVGNTTGTSSKVEITFVINEAPSATLESIRVKTAPKTKYKVGETPNLTGLVLEAVYDNKETMDVTSGYTVSPSTSTPLSTDNTYIRFTWNEETVDMPITVGTLSSLTYNSGTFANKTYTEKDFFDPTGLVVTAHYSNSDGLEEVINDYTLNPDIETELSTTNDKVVVSYTWAGTEQTVNIPITVKAGAKYTVTYNGGAGTPAKSFDTETEYKGGVTLPTANITIDGWVFAGWATAATANTSTRPTLYLPGATYYPEGNITLHAVYTLDADDYDEYEITTSLDQITSAKQIVFVNGSKILNKGLTSATAPTEKTEGKIDEPSADKIWTLSGDNTEGFTLTNGGQTLGTTIETFATSDSYVVSLSGNNNKWLFVNGSDTDLFVLRNKNLNSNSKVGSLQYYTNSSKWQTYFLAAASFASNSNIQAKIYVPVTAYNSNPTQAVITPVVAFNSTASKTLYLDGTTTYTNAASVTGVDKPITYSSSDVSVATVNASGVVKAVGIGTATITASVAAELGVNKAASNTYEVVVKNTTTIAGLKAITDASSVVSFAADLTDAVVTYVNGNHAYIQDASGAVYASCGSSLTVGNKINGAVSGSIKAAYKIDEITAIDLSAAIVTDDGVIPEAEVKTLAQIKAGDYDGKLVTVNGAVVKTGMNDTTSGGVITDDNNTTTFNIYAPNKLTLNATEEGNFTGFVSIYGESSTYRLNIYEESQFVKTRNVDTAQPLAFAEDAIALDEETAEFAAFTGQAVEGAQGTVTYALTGDAIGTVNASTGVVTLNGTCGTATITATAAANEVTEEGVTTPYTETAKSYTITVRPRYTVTFHVNGIKTVVREASYGAGVAVPNVEDYTDYVFRGWNTEAVDPTDTKPAGLTDFEATIYPDANAAYYAVFAQETEGDDENVELYKNTGSTGTDATSGITASGNINTTSSNGNPGNSFGLTSSSNKTATFTNINISTAKSASLNLDYRLAKSGSDYSSLTVTQYDSEDDVLGTPTNITGSDQSYHTSEAISLNKACVKITIVCTPAGSTYNTYVDNVTINVVRPSVSYSDYRTSLPTVAVTIGASEFASFCYDRPLDFTDTDVTAYTAKVDAKGTVTLTKVADGIVPANKGVVLRGANGDYEIPMAATEGTFDFADNQMVGVTQRTQVLWNPSAGVYNYILQGGNFKKASAGYLKPNRAYLSTNYNVEGAGAKPLTIIFAEEETDGIRSVGNTTEDGVRYNLSGQKVGKEYKGIVIVNGKKLIRK